MCFSASISYTASAALLICGIATISKAKSHQRMFAATPFLFAIQQFIEGTTWQALYKGTSTTLGTYAYLFFVLIVWPLWIPLATRTISTNKREKLLLILPLIAGTFVALLALGALWYTVPQTEISCNSIRYIANIPSYIWITGMILYLFATITPFFIIRRRHFWLMGSALAISYLVAFIFYYKTLISIWCFFAALLSIFTLLLVW